LLVEERAKATAFVTALVGLQAQLRGLLGTGAAAALDTLDAGGGIIKPMSEANATCKSVAGRAGDAFQTCRNKYFLHIETTPGGSSRSMKNENANDYDKVDARYGQTTALYETTRTLHRTADAKITDLLSLLASGTETTAQLERHTTWVTGQLDVVSSLYGKCLTDFEVVAAMLDTIWKRYAADFASHRAPADVPVGL